MPRTPPATPTDPPPGDPPVAEDIGPGSPIGDWEVDSFIAEGGFGTIWRVTHTETRRPGAMKILHPDLVSSHTGVLRFEREAKALNLLRHPSIVELFEFLCLADGRPCYVMESLDGASLQARIGRDGALPVDEIIQILEPLCDALATAHEADIVHRDLKATNVLLCEHEGARRVVLLDFGVAKLLDAGGPQLTASRVTVGSPSCMAPEQIRSEPVDARTDVYALGCMTFQMLTGALPFGDAPMVAAHYMHLHGRRPSPSGLADTPPALDEVVTRAMSKEASDRHAGPREFLAAFRAALAPPRRRGLADEKTATRRAIGVFLAVRAEEGALEDPDEALIDDIENVLDLTTEELWQRGFIVAQEIGHTSLLVKPLPTVAEEERTSRTRTVATVISLARGLAERKGRDPRVRVALCLHVDEALLVGDSCDGGAITDTAAWAGGDDVEGVAGSPAVFEGIDCATDPLPGHSSLVAVRSVRVI